MAAGRLTVTRHAPFQAEALPLADRKTELPFLTRDKNTGRHGRTAHHHHAIGAGRFHGESQNSAGPDAPGGLRDLDSRAHGRQ